MINDMIISQAELDLLMPLKPEYKISKNKKPRIRLVIGDPATWIRYKAYIDTFVDQSKPFDTAWKLSDKFMRKMGMTHEEQGYHERYKGIWVA